MPSEASLANLRPPWPPGRSANSAGNARGYRRVLAAARNASPEAMQKAIECMRDESASWRERMAAVAMILDRAYGRPKEHLSVDANGIAVLRVEFVDPRDANSSNGNDTATRTIDADTFEVSFSEPEEDAP